MQSVGDSWRRFATDDDDDVAARGRLRRRALLLLLIPVSVGAMKRAVTEERNASRARPGGWRAIKTEFIQQTIRSKVEVKVGRPGQRRLADDDEGTMNDLLTLQPLAAMAKVQPDPSVVAGWLGVWQCKRLIDCAINKCRRMRMKID